MTAEFGTVTQVRKKKHICKWSATSTFQEGWAQRHTEIVGTLPTPKTVWPKPTKFGVITRVG